jgi:hypothetical protein
VKSLINLPIILILTLGILVLQGRFFPDRYLVDPVILGVFFLMKQHSGASGFFRIFLYTLLVESLVHSFPIVGFSALFFLPVAFLFDYLKGKILEEYHDLLLFFFFFVSFFLLNQLIIWFKSLYDFNWFIEPLYMTLFRACFHTTVFGFLLILSRPKGTKP